MDVSINDALIQKKIVSPGDKYIPMKTETRVKFHYRTSRTDNGVVLDDTRKVNKPMVLVLGKKFKLEVWEVIVQKMALNEVAKFTVDKSLVAQYPFIAKTLRDVDKKSDERRHCCGMTLQNEGIGYKDLDDLFKKPCDLEFIIHLISVELPEEYQKERWQLSDDEKILRADYLHQKGNELYIEKKYELAEKNYFEGIGIIENLMLKEKPHDTEWLALADKKIPLLSNYCQCRLLNNDYYSVIIHCTEVLKLDPSNKKALFRRGKAHTGAWNPKEARADFEDLLRLDPRAKEMVAKELKIIDDEQHKRDVQDKCKLKKLF